MALSDFERARGREYSYRLFGRLFLEGITAELLPYLEAIPDLGGVLPEPFEADETAAAHMTMFGFNVFANASIFLDSSGLLGGTVTDEYGALYRRHGFAPESGVDPDHLGQCLGFLAYLAGEEASALESGWDGTAVQEAQYNFLENHLLSWLVPCTVAIREQGDAFYGRLAELALALTADHHAAGENLKRHRLPVVNYQTEAVLSLEDGRTGLREIAEYLVTPVLSGLYIGRQDINRLARGLKLPHGFGSRAQMLQTLFESAGQYEAASQLFSALEAFFSDRQQVYEQAVQEYPNIAHHVLPWQSRLAQTQEVFLYSNLRT